MINENPPHETSTSISNPGSNIEETQTGSSIRKTPDTGVKLSLETQTTGIGITETSIKRYPFIKWFSLGIYEIALEYDDKGEVKGVIEIRIKKQFLNKAYQHKDKDIAYLNEEYLSKLENETE